MEKRVSKTLDDLESELASLKNSLTEERESHARTSLSKEEVTKSLEENQRLLSSLQATTEQQVIELLLRSWFRLLLFVQVHYAYLQITTQLGETIIVLCLKE